jgi:cell division inhibitor SepF
MSSPLRKMALYLGLVDDGSEGEESFTPSTPKSAPAVRPRPVMPNLVSNARRSVELVHPSTQATQAPALALDLDAPVEKIVTLHPRSYNDARTIGEHYREYTPVIMNLTEMDDADAKRLVDFAAGLVFGHRGVIEKVTKSVFLLSPPNVKVSPEEKVAAAEASFFNQS